MASIAALIDPECGIPLTRRIVPIRPDTNEDGGSKEEFEKSLKKEEINRGKIVKCAYINYGIGMGIVAIIALIFLLLSSATPVVKVFGSIGIVIGAGLVVYLSALMVSRNYTIEQASFNNNYRESGWDINKARHLYDKEKELQATISSTDKLAAAFRSRA